MYGVEDRMLEMSHLSFSDDIRNITNKTIGVDLSNQYHVKYTFKVLGVILGIIMVASVLFNAFAFQHVVRQRERGKKFVHVLMASLFVSNLFMAGLGYPIGILSMNNIHFHVLLSHPYCQFSAYVVFASAVVSITHIVILSIHRYIQFSKPVLSQALNQKIKPALIIIFITWIVGFSCTALPLLGWGRFTVSAYTCSLDFRQRTLSSYTYFAYCVLMFYVIPLLVLIRTRFKITVRHASSFNRLPMRIQKRYANMEAAMFVGFLVCWTPYAMVAMVMIGSIEIPEQIEQICAVFAKSSALINSLIYCFFYRLYDKRANPKEEWLRKRNQRDEVDVIMHNGSVHEDVVQHGNHEEHAVGSKDEGTMNNCNNLSHICSENIKMNRTQGGRNKSRNPTLLERSKSANSNKDLMKKEGVMESGKIFKLMLHHSQTTEW